MTRYKKMYSLATFYRADDWTTLLRILKSERLNSKGQIICAHCGQPITRKYDCIGHHRIPLTEDNVNDVSISLNPDLIDLVHHRCHNMIHNRFGYQCRTVYLVWGSPLSGKTTWVQESMSVGDLIVDIDRIWECVSGQPAYIKPQRLKSVVFGIRDELLDMVRLRRGKWANAYVIGGYPLSMERERLITSLDARSIYVDTPKAECLDRLACCNDGRNVKDWTTYINDWWEKYTPPTLPDL